MSLFRPWLQIFCFSQKNHARAENVAQHACGYNGHTRVDVAERQNYWRKEDTNKHELISTGLTLDCK